MMEVAQVAACYQVNTKHKYSVGRAYSCWMLNLLVHHVTGRLSKVKRRKHDSVTDVWKLNAAFNFCKGYNYLKSNQLKENCKIITNYLRTYDLYRDHHWILINYIIHVYSSIYVKICHTKMK
jgi:hypothetical protein